MSKSLGPLLLFLVALVSCREDDLKQPTGYQIPRSQSGTIPELPLIWDKGLYGQSPVDLQAKAQLSWDEEGLQVLVSVTDDIQQPAKKEKPIFSGDHVELAIADHAGHPPRILIRFAAIENSEEVRVDVSDLRADKAIPFTLHATAHKNGANSTVFKTVIPWAAFPLKPLEGQQLGLNIAVMDFDRDLPMTVARLNGNEDNLVLYPFELVNKSAWIPQLASKLDLGLLRGLSVSVCGDSAWNGKQIEARDPVGNVVASFTLKEREGLAYGNFLLPTPPRGAKITPLWLVSGGQKVGAVYDTGTLDLRREKLLAKSQIIAEPAVFGGKTFPSVTFADPATVENCLGATQIRTRFFDSTYAEVTKAEKPGRYGAVVEIEDSQGGIRTRMLTLYNSADRLRWYDWALDLQPRFATEFGWQVSQAQKNGLTYFLKQRFSSSASTGSGLAAMVSALAENNPEDYQDADARWWIGLKRKLGYYPPATAIAWEPRRAAQPAPQLRPGTEQEAGMKPGARKRLADYCESWARESREPFVVCIARKGVIILHQGFGLQNGKPIALDSANWMASISKTCGAITVMRLVEQGKIDLDAPVSRALPLITDERITPNLIMRHLSGLGQIEHNWAKVWSEPMQDIDAMTGSAAYAAPVNSTYHYSNVNADLVGRMVESLTDEPCGVATRRMVFDPLGCTGSFAYDYAGRRSYGTALDYAKVAQMLMNGGSYGNFEILKPESVAQMMPDKIYPGETKPSGLGLETAELAGFKELAPGHGASSGAVFRYLPEKELVIVITRNTSGPDAESYHNSFFKLLAAELN